MAQQPQLVAGAIRADPGGLAAARLGDAARLFFAVAVQPDFDSLSGLVREHTQRSDEIRAIAPGADDCVGDGGVCRPLDAGVLSGAQWLTAWAAFAAVMFGLMRAPGPGESDLRPVLGLLLFAVVANAVICGVASGDYDRYQLRVAWLLPFGAAAQAVAWAVRRHAVGGATLHSPAAAMIAGAVAEKRP